MELALAMHYRLRAQDTPAECHLLTDTATILPNHHPRVRRIFERILKERGIVIHTHSKVVKIEHGVLYREGGSPLQAGHIIWATAAGAPRWLAANGLETDARGFLMVNDTLQSVSHPCISHRSQVHGEIQHASPVMPFQAALA